MAAVFFAGLGLIIGSFLNVIISREGTGEGIGGRSHCPGCKKELPVRDLIPIVSWVLLRGRCRYCHQSISMQYPFVELVTALLFVLVGVSGLPPLQTMLGLVVVSLSLCVAVYDMRTMLIPDAWSYAFSTAALVYGITQVSDGAEAIVVLASGPFIAFPLWALWAVSRGRWMGMGDVKFALGIGWLLGPYAGYVALLGSFVLGAFVSVFILLPLQSVVSYAQARGIIRLRRTHHHFTMKSEVPFGPFLIVSCLIVWIGMLYGFEVPLI